MAMHWGDEFVNGGVNALTSPAFCPDSKQPEFKHTPVRVSKVSLPWSLVAMAWLPNDVALSARQALQACMQHFNYASCVPFANASAPQNDTTERTGLLFCASHASAVSADVLNTLESTLQLLGPNCLRYTDPKRGQHRSVRLLRSTEQNLLDGFLLAGDATASPWMRTLLINRLAIQGAVQSLLTASKQPPTVLPTTSKTVCTCLNVSQAAIEQQLQKCSGTADERLSQLKNTLQCGTNCGSCVPQLQRMVRLSISI
jgi:assimilatory nitrate reductase catalytic subunit